MTALCSGKICTIFPEKGAFNFWKACTIALEYSERKAIKKLWYIIIILFLTICIVAFMKKMGISIIISNICGIVGIIISILVW
jgi:succinate-acetate transporter protein